MTRLMAAAVVLTVLTLAGVTVSEDKASPTGTFKWRFSNQSAVHTLKLKLEGEKLTGTIQNSKNDPESPIQDAAYKEGIVSFKHTYKGRDGQQIVASYSGSVTQDGIKGTIEIKHPDRTTSIVWDARRGENNP